MKIISEINFAIIAKNIALRKIHPPVAYAVFWLILSTILLTLPGSSFPKENWLDRIWLDKWVHIGMFCIMVVLWCWSASFYFIRSKQLKKIFILVALLFTGYGIGMEFIQRYFISNRSFDLGDIIADAVGCMGGFLFSVGRYIKK